MGSLHVKFYDETANQKELLEFYTEATSYAHSHDMNFSVLNPGYTITPEFMDAKIASIIVSYENYYTNFIEKFPPQINTANETTKLSVMLHHVKEDEFETAMKLSKERGFEYVYFTEDGADKNPWDTISDHLLEHF